MATTELPPSPADLESLPAPEGVATVPERRARQSMLRLPYELRGDSTRAVVLSWLTSRAIVLSLLVLPESNVIGDVTYYARSLHELFHGTSIHQALPEYPLPVLSILLPQYLLGGDELPRLRDPVRRCRCWPSTPPSPGPCGASAADVAPTRCSFWLWFVPAIGPMAYFRFDLVPAMLAGAAVLAAARRPAWSGALTAIGARLKLWPALMLPSFLLRRARPPPGAEGLPVHRRGHPGDHRRGRRLRTRAFTAQLAIRAWPAGRVGSRRHR